MHKYVRDLPAVMTQLAPEIRHFSRDRGGGGQAAQIRELHRAGAHDQQHCRVYLSVRDLQPPHGRLHHRHGNCAVC